jgi:hypothetical protein
MHYDKQYIENLLNKNDRAVEKAIFSVYSSSNLKREHLSPIEYWIKWMVGVPDNYSSFSDEVIKSRQLMTGKHLLNARKMMTEHYLDHLVSVANKGIVQEIPAIENVPEQASETTIYYDI